jgi:cytoskeletal protein CcmA (bactofilin family)
VLNADPIKVHDAVIAGRVEGNVEAEREVRLESSAVVIGNVTGKLLVVEEGAILRGLCDVGETGDLPMKVLPRVEVKKAAEG